MDRMKKDVQKAQESRKEIQFESKAFANATETTAQQVEETEKEASKEVLEQQEEKAEAKVSEQATEVKREVSKLENAVVDKTLETTTMQKVATLEKIKTDGKVISLKEKVKEGNQKLAIKKQEIKELGKTSVKVSKKDKVSNIKKAEEEEAAIATNLRENRLEEKTALAAQQILQHVHETINSDGFAEKAKEEGSLTNKQTKALKKLNQREHDLAAKKLEIKTGLEQKKEKVDDDIMKIAAEKQGSDLTKQELSHATELSTRGAALLNTAVTRSGVRDAMHIMRVAKRDIERIKREATQQATQLSKEIGNATDSEKVQELEGRMEEEMARAKTMLEEITAAKLHNSTAELDEAVEEQKLDMAERALVRNKQREEEAGSQRGTADGLLNDAKRLVVGQSASALEKAKAAARQAANEAEETQKGMTRLANKLASNEISVLGLEGRAKRTSLKVESAKKTEETRDGQLAEASKKVDLATEKADYDQKKLKGAETRAQKEAKKVMFSPNSEKAAESKQVERDQKEVASDAASSAEAFKNVRDDEQEKKRAQRKTNRAKVRVARREFKLSSITDRIAEKEKQGTFLKEEIKNSNEKVMKKKKTQDDAFAMAKEIETGLKIDEVKGGERAEKKEMLEKSKRRSALLEARAALSANNLRREEMSAAVAMKVKVLKMRLKQMEDRALNDQDVANERGEKAKNTARTVLELEQNSKKSRHDALGKVVEANKKLVDNDKQEQESAKEDAEAAGEKAEAAMIKSEKKQETFKKDEQRTHSIDKKSAEAQKHLKTAQKNTEEAAIRSAKADKKFADAKYKHAYHGISELSLLKPGAKPPPEPKGLSVPGAQLEIRVAAQEKNVADLELEKAHAEEKEAQYQATLLAREAQLAKQDDGKAAVQAEKDARDAVKAAAEDQEKANRVERQKEKDIARSDQKTSEAVGQIMTTKTGLSHAKQAAKNAQEASDLAAKQARRSVAAARRVSLKLRDAIDRSARAFSDMDQYAEKSMQIVLPAEITKTSEAWKQAKLSNEKLTEFKDMIDKGREKMSVYGPSISKHEAQQKEKFSSAVDNADVKLKAAMAKIASAEEKPVESNDSEEEIEAGDEEDEEGNPKLSQL